MAGEVFYRQCVLKRGSTQTTSWIPEKYAQVTRAVALKGDDGSWVDGWVVDSVGVRASGPQVRLYEDQHRRQRGVSDI